MKKFCIFLCAVFLVNIFFGMTAFANEDPTEVIDAVEVLKIESKTDILNMNAKACILMEASTGKILFEKNMNDKLPIASVTKVMSMLVIMEAISEGRINYKDKVGVSEYAAGMGGSQAYIEPGEEFTVDEMLKAVAIHSSNDVTVALAEKVAGSEEAFVSIMNQRAADMGLENTYFRDCTGLTDDGHYSSAHDLASISRELVINHPDILKYTSTWRDTFRNGEFALDNTNKMIKQYSGCDGLKTGYTSKAGFNLSATAIRNNMRLISVVLGVVDSKTRFAESSKLLDHGFANYEKIDLAIKEEDVAAIPVRKGETGFVSVKPKNDISLILTKGKRGAIETERICEESVQAPVAKGQKVGELVYRIDGQIVGKTDLVAENDVAKMKMTDLLGKLLTEWLSVPH